MLGYTKHEIYDSEFIRSVPKESIIFHYESADEYRNYDQMLNDYAEWIEETGDDYSLDEFIDYVLQDIDSDCVLYVQD